MSRSPGPHLPVPAEGRRAPPPPCAVCGEGTTGRKPFCLEHVLMTPYARELAAEVNRRTVEGTEAGRGNWRAIDPQSSRSREVLDRVQELGGALLGRLAKLVADDLPEGFGLKAVRSYAQRLEAAGLLKVTRFKNARGQTQWLLQLAPTELAEPAPLERDERRATGS